MPWNDTVKVKTPAFPAQLSVLLLLSYAKKKIYRMPAENIWLHPPDLQFEPRWCLEMLSPLGHFQGDWTLAHTAAAHCMMDLNIPQDSWSWDKVDQSVHVPLCLRMRLPFSLSVFQSDRRSQGKHGLPRRLLTRLSNHPSTDSDASPTHLLGPSCSVCQMIHLI